MKISSFYNKFKIIKLCLALCTPLAALYCLALNTLLQNSHFKHWSEFFRHHHNFWHMHGQHGSTIYTVIFFKLNNFKTNIYLRFT